MSRTNGTENHDSLLHGPCKTFVVTVHEDVYDKDVDFEMISSIVDPTGPQGGEPPECLAEL